MPSYRVRPKFTHGAFNQYKPGDIVQLTEQEAAGFLDKLELVDVSAQRVTGSVVGYATHNIGPPFPIPAPTGNEPGGQANDTPPASEGQPNDGSGSNDAPEPFDVANATVDEVLAAVADGKVTASDALIAEQQGSRKRATLIAELTKAVEAARKPAQE